MAISCREAQVKDAGRYTCIATNRAGEHRITIQLHVLGIIENHKIITKKPVIKSSGRKKEKAII